MNYHVLINNYNHNDHIYYFKNHHIIKIIHLNYNQYLH
jgi:hypothetical protein